MIELYDTPGHLIRRLQQIAVAVFHSEVAKLGFDLTPVQFAALATVQRNKGIDQATLAGLIAYDRATITGVVDRLVQKGLLIREVAKHDRRSRQLRITGDGERTIREITPAVEAAQIIMLQGLTPDEADDLIRLLRKATEGANEMSRAPLKPGSTDL